MPGPSVALASSAVLRQQAPDKGQFGLEQHRGGQSRDALVAVAADLFARKPHDEIYISELEEVIYSRAVAVLATVRAVHPGVGAAVDEVTATA